VKRILLSADAEKDLEDIQIYSRTNWGIKQADTYVGRIFHVLDRISENSDIGLPTQIGPEDLRTFRIGSHRIVYRTTDSGVVRVLRVVHQRRDLKSAVTSMED
jgi:plasmid stabilization system protein ParE